MNIYKRGQVYWCKFTIDNKRYQYSCKTKDKEMAQEIASAIYADTIRSRFNIPAKNKAVYIFKEVFKEYIKNQSVGIKTVERRKIAAKHFLPVLENKNIANITVNDIKTYQLQRKLEIMATIFYEYLQTRSGLLVQIYNR